MRVGTQAQAVGEQAMTVDKCINRLNCVAVLLQPLLFLLRPNKVAQTLY
jgi:hypothetical protein